MERNIEMTQLQSEAWRLRYTHGWSTRRIARKFGVTTSAVRQRLSCVRRNQDLAISSSVKPRTVRPGSLSRIFNI